MMEKSSYYDVLERLITESGTTHSVCDAVISNLRFKVYLDVIGDFEVQGGHRFDCSSEEFWLEDDFLLARHYRYRYDIRIESLLPEATDENLYGLASALTIAFVSEKP
jgi:hypothetical protein